MVPLRATDHLTNKTPTLGARRSLVSCWQLLSKRPLNIVGYYCCLRELKLSLSTEDTMLLGLGSRGSGLDLTGKFPPLRTQIFTIPEGSN